MFYTIFGAFGSLAINAVLAYAYNKGSLAGGIALGVSVVGLGVLGGVFAFAGQQAKTVRQLGLGLLSGSLITVLLCSITLAWIVLYMRGDI